MERKNEYIKHSGERKRQKKHTLAMAQVHWHTNKKYADENSD